MGGFRCCMAISLTPGPVSIGNNANPANKPPIPSTTVQPDLNSLEAHTAGTIAINYLETESVAALGGQMQAAVAKNMVKITPSYASRGSGPAGRITFLGATTITFANPLNPAAPIPFTASMPKTIPSGYVPVTFGAADSSATISTLIAALIDSYNSGLPTPVEASTGGGGVTLNNGSAAVNSPLAQVPGGPSGSPGGNITGLAYLNGHMYCVTDLGGLYEVLNFSNFALKPTTDSNGLPIITPLPPAARPLCNTFARFTAATASPPR